MAYLVSSSDFCSQGFERLRNQNEVLFVCTPSPKWGAPAICRAILEDMQAQGFDSSFDYEAARRAIRAYFAEIAKHWRGRNARQIFGPDAFSDGMADDPGLACSFYVYLETPESVGA